MVGDGFGHLLNSVESGGVYLRGGATFNATHFSYEPYSMSTFIAHSNQRIN